MFVLQEDLHDIGDPEVSETVQEDVIRELVKQRILARLEQTSGLHQTFGETSNLGGGESQGDLRQGVVFLFARVSIQGRVSRFLHVILDLVV